MQIDSDFNIGDTVYVISPDHNVVNNQVRRLEISDINHNRITYYFDWYPHKSKSDLIFSDEVAALDKAIELLNSEYHKKITDLTQRRKRLREVE